MRYQSKSKKDRSRRSQPTAMNSIVSEALQRHGIGRQVTAALVVKRANELLASLLEDHARPDIRVVSYLDQQLNIVCRHAAATQAAEMESSQLGSALEREFPAITITKIWCRINPTELDARTR